MSVLGGGRFDTEWGYHHPFVARPLLGERVERNMDAKIEVPEDVIKSIVDAHIHAAIAATLGKEPSILIDRVVSAALSEKKDSYGRETLFGEKVKAMIREAATNVFGVWLTQNRPLIEAAIRKRLNQETGRFIEQVAEKLVKGMGENFRVSVTLPIE